MNDFLFYLSKIMWIILNPLTFFIILILIVTILIWRRSYALSKIIMTILSGIFIIFVFFPFDYWLMYPLEHHFKQTDPKDLEHFDGVIVLGGEIDTHLSYAYKDPITPWGGERMNKFIELYHKNPHAKFVFSGGSGDIFAQDLKEDECSKQYMEKLGLSTSSIFFEGQSRNTHENALFTQKLMNPLPHEKWVLITSAYHMPRSIALFNKIGWKTLPCPVGYRTLPHTTAHPYKTHSKLFVFTTAFKEWIGLISYYIMGRIDTLFP